MAPERPGAIACDAVAALTVSPDPAALVAVDGIARKFTVRLIPSLELTVTTEAGKAVKSMPAPGKTDDGEKAPAAYEAYKAMKKQIKTTIAAQRARLEMALSVQRCWDSGAWRKPFVENPVMHQFAISLIWGVYENGGLNETFRYMEDGSFNTVDEEEYTPSSWRRTSWRPGSSSWRTMRSPRASSSSPGPSTASRRSRHRIPPWRRWPAASSTPCPLRPSSRVWAGTGAAYWTAAGFTPSIGRTPPPGWAWS